MTVHRLPGAKAPAGYRMVRNAKADAGEVYLYGPIGDSFWGGGISADQFRKDLKALGSVKTIDVRINSEGGDVFDGKAMYSLLVEHPATVTMHIDGLAASAASFVAMAGNAIEIAEGGFVMIHNASGMCFGGAEDMRRTADLLETVNGTLVDVYAARTKNSADDIKKMMADETWMTGKDAVEKGFADKLCPNLAVAASLRPLGEIIDSCDGWAKARGTASFKKVPQALRPNRAKALALLSR